MVPKDLNIGVSPGFGGLDFSGQNYNPKVHKVECLDLLPFWVPEMVPLRGF